MQSINRAQCIVYIGEFDLRNENVQAHLVKNNAKIFNQLGYKVAFIGMNRLATSFKEISTLPEMDLGINSYFELPNTLNFFGLFKYPSVVIKVFKHLEVLQHYNEVKYVISYQSPTYAPLIRKLGQFCLRNNIPYIVNSADIPIFDSQMYVRKLVMNFNWHLLHKYNNKYAVGVIAVSKFIDNFYKKKGRPSIIVPPLFDEVESNDFILDECVTFVYAGTPFIESNSEVNPDGMKDRLDKVIDLLLHLAEKNIDFRCVIVGITKEKYSRNVPRHADILKDNSHFIFKGRLQHSDTLIEVKNADYMINYRDVNRMTEAGLSTKVVESVSLGTPVVMNPIGDTFNYLIEGLSGYKLTGDFKTDFNLLVKLCENNVTQRIDSKRHCANSKVFSLDRYKEAFLSFFNQIH